MRRLPLLLPILVVVLPVAGCQLQLLLGQAAVPTGQVCAGNWDCDQKDDCICGRCQARGTPPACEPVPGDSERCPDARPVCITDCTTHQEVPNGAVCGESGWECVSGVPERGCPIGSCSRPPGPGQICTNGVLLCEFGDAPGGGCYTPSACDDPDGGPTIAPGCRFDLACPDNTISCRNTWCRDGDLTPASCIDAAWQCEQGMLASTCPPACELVAAPACFAACGDPQPVGLAECTDSGAFECSSGVLRDACPPETCWAERPANADCVDGGWVCRDGVGPGGGCLTPGTCTGTAPGCFETPCCTGDSTSASCEENAWSCGSLSTLEDCQARPFCGFPSDGGTP